MARRMALSRSGGTSRRRYRPRFFGALLAFAVLVAACAGSASAFSLTEFLGDETDLESSTTLSLPEITELRARDIKRRLSRTHGYGADELARMLDKKELINALAYEEHRQRQKDDEARRRYQLRRSIVVAVVAVLLVMFWPLIKTAWDVASVNFVVYTDRKRHEGRTCYEHRSGWGALGVLCMFVVDMLSLWLSASILMSWVVGRNKYSFPMPSIPVRPAALLAASTGGNAGALGQYGINVAPMIITWAFRWGSRKLEYWTGKALVNAQKRRRKEEKARRKKEGEAPWEKQARREAKAKRRAEREAKQQEEARRAAETEEAERAKLAEELAKTTERYASNAKNAAATGEDEEGRDDDAGGPLSVDDMRSAAAAAAEARIKKERKVTESTAFDELD
mmetsp:Transcript_12272/g.35124  ORF Transcript_12272/g.35124 Transcript_12272/m.35124 type:complete len:395 (+) Transcript_12272:51-1235(+)